MKKGFALALSLFGSLITPAWSANLAPSFQQDKEAIKKMAGCYEVSFQNAETFALTKDYTYRDRFKTGGLELIVLDSEDEKSLGLQHLLITPGGIIKHWRQVWTYEDEELYDFQPPALWKRRALTPEQASLNWTQKVYQVDDSPRYECSAPWIHHGSTHYWECEAQAPLPRREFTTRKDYNILKRNNRHEITAFGHIHDEDNTKIAQEINPSSGQKVQNPLVMEKGLNSYKKVEDSRCQPAIQWWKEHELFWKDVQVVWKEFYAREDQLNFRDKVDGKTLWEKLFQLDEVMAATPAYSSQKVREESKKTILQYLIFPH